MQTLINPFVTLLILLVSATTITAQPCGTIESAEAEQFLMEAASRDNNLDMAAAREVVKYVAVTAHIIRKADGTGGYTREEVDRAFKKTNEAFAGMNFVFCVREYNYINDQAAATSQREYHDATELRIANANNKADRLNIYFYPSSSTSWAHFPTDPENWITMQNAQANNGKTLTHEIGHYFNLFHTHHSSRSIPRELVDGSNCASAGDLICDTPADPGLSGLVNSSCVYTGSAVDANGDAYTPATRNYMAYTHKPCRTEFSPQQQNRMIQAYFESRTDLIDLTDRNYAFQNPGIVLRNFGPSAGAWDASKHLRKIADVNGDGRVDVVGFGQSMTFVALGTADGSFGRPIEAIRNFAFDAGSWRMERHVRELADVNGDGRADIVGFGEQQVLVALGQENGTFSAPIATVRNFTPTQGWQIERHPRLLADVNGDGRADIIGFGNQNTFVSLGQANGSFGNAFSAVNNFSIANGWDIARHDRFMADVNGDCRADIVGFGESATFVALGKDDGKFENPITAIQNFAIRNGGWTKDRHVRTVGDVNGDGYADIVGFGEKQVLVALGTAQGRFGQPRPTINNLCVGAGGWQVDQHPRMLADVNCDGLMDVVGFGGSQVFFALGKRNGTFAALEASVVNFSASAGWTINGHPRTIGDVDGDGRPDIIGFANAGLMVAKGFRVEEVVADFAAR